MNILTKYSPPPIKSRVFDWSAWLDGDEDRSTGFGKTEEEAIEDLKERLEISKPETGE